MSLKYLKDVATLKLDSEKCTGCGMCLEVCPHDVFALKDRKSEVRDGNSCMECGACARNCLFSAIEVRAGVGCAAGILYGKLRGTEATCGCSDDNKGSCCG